MPGMCGTLWRIQEASGLSAMEVGEARGKAVALRPSHGGGKEFASQGQKREGHWGWCNNMSKDRQESKGELAQSVKSVSETVGQWTSGTYWDPAVESLKGQAMGFWLSSAGRGEPWLVFELRNDSGCLIWQHRIKQMGGSRERHKLKDLLGGSCCLLSWPELIQVKEGGWPATLLCLCAIRFPCRGVGTKIGSQSMKFKDS